MRGVSLSVFANYDDNKAIEWKYVVPFTDEECERLKAVQNNDLFFNEAVEVRDLYYRVLLQVLEIQTEEYLSDSAKMKELLTGLGKDENYKPTYDETYDFLLKYYDWAILLPAYEEEWNIEIEE